MKVLASLGAVHLLDFMPMLESSHCARVITAEPGAPLVFQFLRDWTGHARGVGDDVVEREPHDDGDYGFKRLVNLPDGRERWEFRIPAYIRLAFDVASDFGFDQDAIYEHDFGPTALRLVPLGFRRARETDLPRLLAALAACWNGVDPSRERKLADHQLVARSLVSDTDVFVPEEGIGTLGHLHTAGESIAEPIGSGWGTIDTGIWGLQRYRLVTLQSSSTTVPRRGHSQALQID